MFSGNRTFFCGPYIPLFRLRSQPSAARYSRSSQIKVVHRLSITACHSRLAAARPRNLVSLSSLSQAYVEGQDNWEKLELPPSDAQRRTIYALSTPPGKGGIAVIRVSGPDALEVWQTVVDPSFDSRKGKGRATGPEPWRIHRCKIVHPVSKEVLDDGLAVFFKGPKSFTAEDVLELHIHSGRAVISSVLHALSSLPYCRLAEPGEFTRRAFSAGRLDLTQVEGLKDLINANTESQRKLALRATEGVLRSWLDSLRAEVIKCLGLVEALIDFSEEDIEEGVYDQARELAFKISEKIKNRLSSFHRGEILRSGIRLAIFGPPNAGKSSLFNVLAQREAAIVTNVPGTTRDILEISLDIGGLPVIIADTAGLRVTHDVVEKIGIERATEQITCSDISLCILSADDALGDDGGFNIPPEIRDLITAGDTYLLLNKTDLISGNLELDQTNMAEKLGVERVWVTSLRTGDGLKIFLEEFGRCLEERYGLLHDNGLDVPEPMITHSRHRVHLESALRFLTAFLNTPEEDIVFGAEELRYASQSIGKITGGIDVEDVLDVIFRDFCIGK